MNANREDLPCWNLYWSTHEAEVSNITSVVVWKKSRAHHTSCAHSATLAMKAKHNPGSIHQRDSPLAFLIWLVHLGRMRWQRAGRSGLKVEPQWCLCKSLEELECETQKATWTLVYWQVNCVRAYWPVPCLTTVASLRSVFKKERWRRCHGGEQTFWESLEEGYLCKSPRPEYQTYSALPKLPLLTCLAPSTSLCWNLASCHQHQSLYPQPPQQSQSRRSGPKSFPCSVMCWFKNQHYSLF